MNPVRGPWQKKFEKFFMRGNNGGATNNKVCSKSALCCIRQTSNGVTHNHEKAAPCPHCTATNPVRNKISNGADNQAPLQITFVTGQAGNDNKTFGEKLRAFLGVCGCLSCYVAMFPALLLGIVGIFGLSNAQTLNALNTYRSSVLFQPILVVSILFLIISSLRYGKLPLILSAIGGLGIFTSMNFYMTGWLFTLSFGILAIAYYLAFQKTKAQPLKIALVLLFAVVVLGVIDVARTAFSAPSSSSNPAPPAAMPQKQNMMNMMQ